MALVSHFLLITPVYAAPIITIADNTATNNGIQQNIPMTLPLVGPVTLHHQTVETNDRLLVKTATVRRLSLFSIQFRTAHYHLSSRPFPL
jgi:hypothetical protein